MRPAQGGRAALRFSDALEAMRKGKRDKAKKMCERLLKAEPKHADALHLLGVIERESGRAKRAVTLIRRSLEYKSGVAAAHYNLGSALQDLQQWQEAEASYRQVLMLNPRHPRAGFGLGCVLGRQERYEEAVEPLAASIALDPQFPEAHHNLAVYLVRLERWDDALHHARRAAALRGDDPEIQTHLGELLAHAGEIEAARQAFANALRRQPESLSALWGCLHALPRVHDNMDTLQQARVRWSEDLDAFSDALRLDTPAAVTLASRLALKDTNFFLHYQGRNDRSLQLRYAAVLTCIAQAALPAYTEPRPARVRNDGEPLRIGFVSSFFRQHSVARTLGRFITDLDSARFETHAYSLWPRTDAATDRIRNAVAHFHHLPESVTEVAAQIVADDLDFLLYTDIGMDPKVQMLAPLHLAPLQASTLGHPVTSGLDAIHYYFSSAMMEPLDGDDHYTEQLVRLPNLGMDYPRPNVSAADPSTVIDPQRGGGPVYLCSQNLFKLLPSFDEVLASIAAGTGLCRIWLLETADAQITRRTRERITRCFKARGLVPEDYVYWFPRPSSQQFLAINKAADVILDPFSWSGFNSTMEALACGVPVVTLPGASMRARHTMACLQRIGLEETIARDADNYVSLAVRLGRDSEWRESITERLRVVVDDPACRLFNDEEPTRAFAEFIESAVG